MLLCVGDHVPGRVGRSGAIRETQTIAAGASQSGKDSSQAFPRLNLADEMRHNNESTACSGGAFCFRSVFIDKQVIRSQ